MISYACTINGTSVDIEIGATIKLDGTEEFDSGIIVVKHTTRSTKYTEGDAVVVTVGSTQYPFIIQADRIEQITSTLYDHYLTLTEETAKGTKTIITDRFFSVDDNGALWTHDEMLDIIKTTTPIGKSSVFNVATATRTALDTTSPQKKFEGMNLFQTWIDIFRGIKAVPRMVSGVLYHKYYNELNNPITLSNVIGSQKEYDFNNYATTITSKAKNITYDSDLLQGATWIPSDVSGMTPRSTTGDYSDDNAVYDLRVPIRRVIKANLIDVAIKGGTETLTMALTDDYIVSKEEWDGLPIGSSSHSTLYTQKAQRTTLYYNINGTTIEGMAESFKDSLTITRTRMEMMIKRYLYYTAGYSTSDYDSADIKDYQLQVYVQPYVNADISSEKWSEQALKRSEILNNQKDTILDIGRYGSVLSDIANRLSNGSWLLKCRHSSAGTKLELNDYTSDNYKVIKAKYELYPNHIDATYELAKDWVTINGYQTVYRSTDPYTIGRDNVNSNYKYTEYIEFSTTQRTTTGSLTSYGQNTLMNMFSYNATYNRPIYGMQYYSTSSNQGSSAITTWAVCMGGGGIKMITGFQHPKWAGDQIDVDPDISGAYIMTPIRYADDIGFVDDIQISFIDTVSITPDDYPLSSYATFNMVDIPTLTIKKNPNEILGFNYELNPCTDEPDVIIVGEGFSIYNNLVRELSGTEAIRCYVSLATTRYTPFDKFIKEEVSESTEYGVDFNNRYVDVSSVTNTDTKTWAIGYNDGTNKHLLFAVNYDGTTRQRIYLNNLLERSNTTTL